MSSLVKIIIVFLLPAGYAGCNEWYLNEVFPPSVLPNSIFHKVSFIYFHTLILTD